MNRVIVAGLVGLTALIGATIAYAQVGSKTVEQPRYNNQAVTSEFIAIELSKLGPKPYGVPNNCHASTDGMACQTMIEVVTKCMNDYKDRGITIRQCVIADFIDECKWYNSINCKGHWVAD